MPINNEMHYKDITSPTQVTKARYNRISFIYNFMESLPEVFFADWRARLVTLAKGKILEVGVGTGKNFKYYPAGADVTGIDIADKMIGIAKKKTKSLNLSFKIEEGDAQDLPLNFMIVRIVGANINRRTLDNVKAAGLLIEGIEHLGLMKMVKRVIARPNK